MLGALLIAAIQCPVQSKECPTMCVLLDWVWLVLGHQHVYLASQENWVCVHVIETNFSEKHQQHLQL